LEQYEVGKLEMALQSWQQGLTIYQQIGDRENEGLTLYNIGVAYKSLGQYTQALASYQQSLAICRELKDRQGEGEILNGIGDIYFNQGQFPQAQDAYQQALKIFQSLDDRTNIGATLNNLGVFYNEMGQYSQALEFLKQALEIHRELGDQLGEEIALLNIGLVYKQLGQYPKALDNYQQALVISKEIGDRPGIGLTLNNIGLVYDQQGQHSQALKFLQEALLIYRELGDRLGEGNTLDSLGTVYKSLGEYSQALASYQEGLTILKKVGQRGYEKSVLSNMGDLFQQLNQPELAIIFYKQSVNLTEVIRKDLTVLSREQQQSYTQAVADTYRRLADLLLQQNRVIEAQRVLDLLKLQELEDYLHDVRGNEQTAQGIGLLSLEQPIWTAIASLLNRSEQPERTKPLNEFIKTPDVVELVQQLRQKAREQRLDAVDLDILQDAIRQLKQNAVLLYPLILEDRLELVLVTANGSSIHRTVPVNQQDLNHAIVEFLDALIVPRQTISIKPAQATGRQLYNWLIKPIENELTQANAQTIIYAPDGQLRYIPLAALFDGKHWLVERFAINNITAASLINFKGKLPTQPRVLAAAFTQGEYDFRVGTRRFVFSGLEFAGPEVDNIAVQIPGTRKLIDRAFSRAATENQLNNYNIVHFATHGAFVPGQPEDSFILFGNGDRATLRDVENWNLKNVDLVVLSACQTGVGGTLGDGEEILGLGYQMQRAGALATIASLWSVNDQGTQLLMNAFYEALQKGNITKAEALRQSQITLITDRDYIHPYYWAPFILIGNGL
jgi:CHAT domain-containing protein/Tfp pilus assembly protein PilF